MIKLCVNSDEFEIQSELDLTKCLQRLKISKFNEIWISGFGKSSLTVLTNQEKAFLMYLQNEEDAGFNSINPEIKSDNTIDFQLSNGQMDEYPLNFLVDLDLAEKSIIEYYKTGQMCDGVNWVEN